MNRILLMPVLACGFALSACSPSAGPPVGASSNALGVATLQKVNTQAHQCWLKDPDFSAYGIVPELDTTGTPRLLVIPRGKPQALPKLVIAANGSNISLYGPLSTSELTPRIQSDVARWAKGATGCA